MDDEAKLAQEANWEKTFDGIRQLFCYPQIFLSLCFTIWVLYESIFQE